MIIRTASDLGALIRDRRTKLGLDQASLAQRAGTSRKWLVEVEQGKPRASVGLILRTLRALDVFLEVDAGSKAQTVKPVIPFVDLDKHLEKLRKKP
ncbi:MAG TPA: helix-turn-helix domain-containing protein [Candidatus Angelobacter sp.]|nr:helix-turn-helix domain-containing protein [Candidatus Angelobacter sp.]